MILTLSTIILLFLFSSRVNFILINSINIAFVNKEYKEIIKIILNIINSVDLNANYNSNAIY